MRTLLLTAALFFTGLSWLTACGPDPEPSRQLMHKKVGGDCGKTFEEAADAGEFCL